MPSLAMIYVALGLIVSSAIGAGALVHKFDGAKLAKVELGYKNAEVDALKKAVVIRQKQNDISLAAAVSVAASQQKIVTETQIVTKEIVRHVPVSIPCITYGFIRVHDAAVFGVSPDTLPLPAGKSDDTCAPIGADAVAKTITENYGRARLTAEQLNDLEDFILDQLAATDNTEHP